VHAPAAILWPVAAHLVLIFALYGWLTLERKAAVRRGEAQMSDYRLYEREPLRARLIANNLANQFELPLLFYVLAAILYLSGAVAPTQAFLAWAFVAGRIAHAFVHILSPDVGLRGNVFTVNFLALAAMWGLFLRDALA